MQPIKDQPRNAEAVKALLGIRPIKDPDDILREILKRLATIEENAAKLYKRVKALDDRLKVIEKYHRRYFT